MASSLSNFVNDNINMIIKNVKNSELNIKIASAFMNTQSLKMI